YEYCPYPSARDPGGVQRLSAIFHIGTQELGQVAQPVAPPGPRSPARQSAVSAAPVAQGFRRAIQHGGGGRFVYLLKRQNAETVLLAPAAQLFNIVAECQRIGVIFCLGHVGALFWVIS